LDRSIHVIFLRYFPVKLFPFLKKKNAPVELSYTFILHWLKCKTSGVQMLRLIGIVGFQSNFLCSSAQSVFVTPNFIFCRLICKKNCECFISKSIEPFNSRAVFELDHICCIGISSFVIFV